jgi:hypothetical protein
MIPALKDKKEILTISIVGHQETNNIELLAKLLKPKGEYNHNDPSIWTYELGKVCYSSYAFGISEMRR